MIQSIVHIALVVNDYDEAIDFYTKKLHFELVEDTYQPEQKKRWVVVSPPSSNGTTILLAKATKKVQEYGKVAVFKDLYGNLWDLIEFVPGHPMFTRVK